MNEPIRAAAFLEQLQRYMQVSPRHENLTVQVVVLRPGTVGGTPCVPVVRFAPGIDWDSQKLMLYTDHPVSVLRPDQVEAIQESVRKGQSWHAYQREKVVRAEIEGLRAVIVAQRGTIADLQTEIDRLKQGGA